MTQTQQTLAENILKTLASQRFDEFYNGSLENYIGGIDDKTPPDEQKTLILQQIVTHFNL